MGIRELKCKKCKINECPMKAWETVYLCIECWYKEEHDYYPEHPHCKGCSCK